MTDSSARHGSSLNRLTGLLGLTAVALMVAGALGYRFGVLPLRAAVIYLPGAAAVMAAVTIVLGLVTIVLAWRAPSRQRIGGTVVAMIASGAIVLQLGLWIHKANNVPAIHDISTDVENPPLFDAVLPLRTNAVNPPAYPGSDVAVQQRSAYPDLHTLVLNGTVADVLEACEAAARDDGWTVVSADPASGRLEATATTFWYGFTDDIVVRLVESDGEILVDVRSKSRVGVSDLGTNAARIRRFTQRVQAQLVR